MQKKITLDPYEQAIEDMQEEGNLVPNAEQLRAELVAAASAHLQDSKNHKRPTFWKNCLKKRN